MSDSTSRARFIRWQALTIQQLGAVNNLLIGLATGIIALECRYIPDLVDFGFCEMLILGTSLLCLTCSVGFGLGAACNRLLDFRWTAQIAKLRRPNRNDSPIVAKLRKEVKSLGKRTWCYFRWQSVSFALGGLLALLSIFASFLSTPQSKVEGQVFRIGSDGHVEKASGAEVHVFRMPDGSDIEPNAEVNRLRRESKRNCDAIASALHRQYAETVQGIDPRLVSNPIGTSLQEEWMYIQARPEFANLSDSKKRLVKQAFWLRRVQEGQDAFDEAKLQHLWEIIFDAEIKEGRVSAKRQNDPFISDQQALFKELISEERLEGGTISENADADGHFSFSVKRGTFLIVVEGELPVTHFEPIVGKETHQERHVWTKTITVPLQNIVVLAEPFCEP
jgi:hypothetical protein